MNIYVGGPVVKEEGCNLEVRLTANLVNKCVCAPRSLGQGMGSGF